MVCGTAAKARESMTNNDKAINKVETAVIDDTFMVFLLYPGRRIDKTGL
jgi:hypothetical protein